MARILVAGGLFANDVDKALSEARERFANAIGREVIARGHVLLAVHGNCRVVTVAA